MLRSTFSKEGRERIWRGVKAVVEQNSNVRAGNREGERTGEWSRVWEWIGPVDLGKGSSEGDGRRRGRSAGLIISEVGEGGERNGAAGDAAGRELVQGRKWDEGRPIY